MSVYPLHTFAKKAREGIGTEVADDHEPPYGCWESTLGPLEKQPVFSIAERSLQPPRRHLLFVCV